MPTRMGLAKDDLVLEVGRDNDCDSTLRDQIMAITGTTFLEGSTSEVVDAVIIWWRDGDGDLVDELMDYFHIHELHINRFGNYSQEVYFRE
ncbi:MAG: DUF3052 domain-containing protein [Candidatus Planktophila sp.]|nr:DUF3052 domain-containing protein [Candidatus Planktophila sp.]